MSFCLAINCIDGRVQEPVISYIKKQYNCKYVTLITEPGPVQFLTEDKATEQIAQHIYKRVDISLQAHNPQILAIVAHEGCAGNPESTEVQTDQIKQAQKILATKYPQKPVIGLWVDGNFAVHKIAG